ncbi:enhancer of split m4 protein-like [Stomoxys calcitrans]|uniref:enhancer of split m4 protein-like n=1 Tax=Stomoxys calcitrans TaxID=35570 RepID=UPI0027E235AB|nr:enhancer of split m4 protein-like [Stomoxys calcitrans]
MNLSNKKVSLSIKKLMKQLFKRHKCRKGANVKHCNKKDNKESMMPLASRLDGSHYIDLKSENNESFCTSENNYTISLHTNEVSLLSTDYTICDYLFPQQPYELEDFDISILTTIPVHFLHTQTGAFFWTSESELPPDNDLVEPLACSTYNQLACMQYP